MTTLNFNPFSNLREQIEYGCLANACGFGQDNSKSSFACIAEKIHSQDEENAKLKQEIQDLKTRLREEIKGRCDDICSAATKYRDDMIAKETEIATLRGIPLPLPPSAITHDGEFPLVDQSDFKTDNLYWGVTCGHVTVWRLPEDLVIPDDKDFGDVFGNKWCLGEEWGGLNTVCIKTVTQEMIDCEQFHL